MKKHGFTLIEVIVSMVLVSVVMVSLLGSLIQLRQTYTVIHENSDIIVYSSSISRVINNDLTKNNGIRYCTCSTDGKTCDIILGNDQRRKLSLLKKCYNENGTLLNDSECDVIGDGHKQTIRTTLKYVNNTDKNNNKLLYIRTFEMQKAERKGSIGATGYAFSDMYSIVYEHDTGDADPLIDQYTKIVIRLNNEVNEDISKHDVILYTAGRYDYSNLIGQSFRINLNNNGATTAAGTTELDLLFGVGYFPANDHAVGKQLSTIKIPENGEKAFKGYYYYPDASDITQRELVIDSNGYIVSSSRFFRNDIEPNNDNTAGKPVILAEWGDCDGGYELINGKCQTKTFHVTLNKNGGTGGTSNYTVKYRSQVPDIDIPSKTGFDFDYYDKDGNIFHDNNGKGLIIYEYEEDVEIDAQYTPKTYIVSFDVNGGSGGQSDNVTATYGLEMPSINTTAPTLTGYDFMGWYDNKTYTSGTKYYNANGTSAKNYDKTKNMTLYAGWKAHSHTVTFDCTPGSGAPTSQTALYGSNFTLTSSLCSARTGYTQDGWTDDYGVKWTAANTNNWKWQNQNGHNYDKDINLKANWSVNTYTITFNCNMSGATGAPSSINVKYGQVVSNFPQGKCSKSGYTQDYWAENSSGTGTKWTYDNTHAWTWNRTSNITLYAKWTNNTDFCTSTVWKALVEEDKCKAINTKEGINAYDDKKTCWKQWGPCQGLEDNFYYYYKIYCATSKCADYGYIQGETPMSQISNERGCGWKTNWCGTGNYCTGRTNSKCYVY